MQHAIHIVDDGATANHYGDQHHKIVNGKNTPLIVTKKYFHVPRYVQVLFFNRLHALFGGGEAGDKHQAADNAKQGHRDLNAGRAVAGIEKVSQR